VPRVAKQEHEAMGRCARAEAARGGREAEQTAARAAAGRWNAAGGTECCRQFEMQGRIRSGVLGRRFGRIRLSKGYP
jgi:hypothetical protein